MTPLVAIHPYTPHREIRACAKLRRVENATNQHDLDGEQKLHGGSGSKAGRRGTQGFSSRIETDHTVSIWDCVLPDAAFAAQVIAQSLPAHDFSSAILAYHSPRPASAGLLDRRV